MNPEISFWKRAEMHPERTAVFNPDGSTVSYGDLVEQVNRLSHGLRAMGVERASAISFAARNHASYFAVNLAMDQIGAYTVPVNWHLAPAEIAYIVDNSESKLVIVGPGLEEKVAEALDELSFPADARFKVSGEQPGDWRPLSDITDGQPADMPETRLCGSMMLYTSGTTGRPKGVRRPVFEAPPETLVAMLEDFWAERGMVPGDEIYFGPAPLYHAAPGLHAMASLHLGHTVVLMDGWDSERALAAVQEQRVTTTHLAPIHIQRWLQVPEETRAAYDMSSLKSVIHAGAPIPVGVKQAAMDWLGPILFEYYGGSEGPFTSVTAEEWLEHPGTVGNVDKSPQDIKVIDEETGEELPRGEVGLLYSKHPVLDFEYHGDKEKTEEAHKDGYFTLGDLGYIDEDGWLFMSDRRTDMILSGGVNVYPAEVEDRLTSHPAVADVGVVGVPDDEWGNAVAAVVQLAEGHEPSDALAGELKAHCAAGLAKFKVPRDIHFRDELPRIASGKLQRRKLRDELTG